MSERATLHDEEWQTLQFAVLWVETLMAGADGKPDEKEAAAGTEALREGLHAPGRLFREVVQSLVVDLSDVGVAFLRDSRTVLEGLRDVARVLDEHASHDEAVMFKGQVLLVGKAVAEASGRRFTSRIGEEEAGAWSRAAAALGHDNAEFNALLGSGYSG